MSRCLDTPGIYVAGWTCSPALPRVSACSRLYLSHTLHSQTMCWSVQTLAGFPIKKMTSTTKTQSWPPSWEAFFPLPRQLCPCSNLLAPVLLLHTTLQSLPLPWMCKGTLLARAPLLLAHQDPGPALRGCHRASPRPCLELARLLLKATRYQVVPAPALPAESSTESQPAAKVLTTGLPSLTGQPVFQPFCKSSHLICISSAWLGGTTQDGIESLAKINPLLSPPAQS